MTSLLVPVDENQLHGLQESAQRLGLPVEEVVRLSIAEYLRRCEVFDRAAAIDVQQMKPYLAKVFGPAGWDDTEMDCYNELDPRRT